MHHASLKPVFGVTGLVFWMYGLVLGFRMSKNPDMGNIKNQKNQVYMVGIARSPVICENQVNHKICQIAIRRPGLSLNDDAAISALRLASSSVIMGSDLSLRPWCSLENRDVVADRTKLCTSTNS